MIDNIKGLVRPYISVALVSVTAYLAINESNYCISFW